MRSYPIGVFDSGIGGLTVVKEIVKVLPHEDLIYLGDTARVPYGTRENRTIVEFANELVGFMLKQGCKAIVVACNTISAVALSEIKRKALKIPVIDVISPTVSFAVASNRGNGIGVIGTRATINSQIYPKKIHDLNPKINVITKSGPLFVPLAEEGEIDSEAAYIIAREYLEFFNDLNIDQLILGCTHYPVLSKVIREVLRRRIEIVNSAFPTSLELENQLRKHHLLRENNPNPVRTFLATDDPQRATNVASLFIGNEINAVFSKIKL